MLNVLLTTEGTYPYARGGVGTWCDTLVRRTQGVRYHVMAVIANPYLPLLFQLPPQVKSLHPVPLWGTEDPAEQLRLSWVAAGNRRNHTTRQAVSDEFLPLVDRFLEQMWGASPDGRTVGQIVLELWRFFQAHDYQVAFKAEPVWDHYREMVLNGASAGLFPKPTLHEMVQGLGWLYRFLSVLTHPIPQVDVSHVSAAAFSALPAVVARLEFGTPMLLTEHGVYLREQYLSVAHSGMRPFERFFLLSLVAAVTRAALSAADQVSPVAAYNCRWESRLGVPPDRFQVIYNGVDPAQFPFRPRPAGAPLTVVSVARIDPIKDLESLVRAAAMVRKKMPEITFTVYGGISVPSYYERLLQLRSELSLEGGFSFAGHVEKPALAYQSGDVIALSSISEGFPYGVVEAMMSGRPVVATDVGGTAEALGGLGELVPPRQPEQLAEGLLRLLGDEAYRAEQAAALRQRALSHFTLDRQIELYLSSYRRLAACRSVPLRDAAAK